MIISKIGCCALALIHVASAASIVPRGRIGDGGGGGGGGGDDPHRLRALQDETATPSTTPSTPPTTTPTTTGKPTSASPTTRKPTVPPTTRKPTTTRTPTVPPTTRKPTGVPSTRTPTVAPTFKPTQTPTSKPTSVPTGLPTSKPTTVRPTSKPTSQPTSKPTSVPTGLPTSKPTTDRPTSKPTSQPTSSPTTAAPTTLAPTSTPTAKPTNSPVLPYDNPVLSCPLPGATMVVITPGVKQVAPAAANTFCGIFLRQGSESGNIIPLARSYHGRGWEAAPGPLACPTENVNATTVVLPDLQDADDRYVILAKDGSLSEKKQIAKFLETTTFGPKRSEIDAIAADGLWTTSAAAKRAAHLRSQIDLPMTSHREYYRKRANTKWDATAQPARSDHPCSPNSKWRKYSYIQQDRLNTNSEAFVITTFETVKVEENLTTTIYEADNATQVLTRGFGTFWTAAPTATNYGYSGKGYYDMGGTDDFVQFTVNVPSAGIHPISFRYSMNSVSFNGNRKMQLQVNDVVVRHSYDFFFTASWSYWKYTELIDVSLNAGDNTIKLRVVEQNGGPNIDHLRVGKPPAIVLKTNGWPRVIARNGLYLLDDWPYEFTNTTQVYFQTNNPDAPQGGLFRYPYGRLRVLLPNGKERFLEIGNPPINFTGYEQYLPQNVFTFDGSEIWDETASDLYNHPLMRGQELLLRNGFNGAICDLVPPFAEEYDAPIFGKLPSGEWLQWTPTILLEDNGPSINDPPGNRTGKVLVDGGGEAFVITDEKLKCSNVRRSFINEDTCFLSTLSTACSATNPVGEVIMTMNTTLVVDLFDLTGREVYAIKGLVMESRMESPCAKTRSRWVAERGATCPAPSALGANTIMVLKNAIIASTNKNEYVTDVDRPSTALCNAVDWDQDSDPIHIQLQVGPDCYTHVHPDHLNVYDFTGWITNHPGGGYHIEKWSQGWESHPGWYLTFPFYGNTTRKIPAHPMNRWVTKAKEPDIVKVGRLGDNIAFRDLLSELKTDAVAEYFGATPISVADGGVVVCGSMGEVSNDPSFTEVFDVNSNEFTVSSSDSLNNQKSVVWTEVALYGDDQLRQRMAWALAQIITAVPVNIDAYDNTEIFTHFYDIFVKHAFGNYRDILGETSFSPLMAEHLSYLKSKSHSYVYEFENKRIARADENFAREVMQLFSIGLIVLNDDGTPLLDPVTGNPLETYTNEDIESLARAWTGFDRTAVRGNYEEGFFTGTSDNRMDPMQIVPDYRDPFPKSNLDGGFIGDGYLLCSDIPDKSFLKKGAGYRLLGGKPSPELMKDPTFFTSTTPGEILRAVLNPSSQLYQTLHNSGKVFVTLDSDLVCTPGTFECLVDTLRIVKVGSVYYEFVERPCVQLGFYNNGKQIQLRDNWRRGQMCANTDLAHAREACCREDRVSEVNPAVMESNVTYFYDGERMRYETARDRCVAYGRDLCFYEWLEIKSSNDSRKLGYHWTNRDCAINVKVNSEGYIAIVHDAVSTSKDTIPWLVEETNTLNWFRVFWDGNGDYPGSNETNTCEANNCKVVVNDDGSSSCLCKTIVTDSVVFTDTNISKENVMSKLFIGALGPQAGSVPTSLGIGFTAHIAGSIIDGDTVFEVQDKGRTIYLKNTLSTVSLEGWTMVPQIYEAEAATISNAPVKNNTISPTGKKYVEARFGNQTTYIQWNVTVPSAGEYLISLRYSHDSSPRPLSVYVNTQLVDRPPTNPNTLLPFANIGNDPTAAQLPLQRCAGDCDIDGHCVPGLFCMRNNRFARVPGCSGGTQANHDYCVDINDFNYGFTLLPTGGWDDDWQISKPLQVNLNAGQNLIRVQLPPLYKEGPNIDHLKVEGLPVSSPSSFRNPPHFMSLIPDYGSGRIGERNLRDAQYETEAVLDHYFYQDNVAPFICVRVMQRFSFSNPSPRFISSCVEAFRTGLYTSEATTFGSGKYGSLEAMAASILLDSEATEGAISVDPSSGSMREPILKLMNLMRSMDYQTSLPTPIDGALIQTTYNVKLWEIDEKIGHGPYEFPTVFSFFLPHYLPDSGPNHKAKLASPESVVVTMPNIINLLNGMFSLIKYGLTDCNNGFSLSSGYGSCLDDGSYQRSFGHLFYTPSGANDHERVDDLAQLLTAGRLSQDNLDKIVVACSTEPNQESRNRCMMQLIVTTGEFHSTNTVTQTGEDRVSDATSVNSTEPYKAIVYFFLSGGLDSYHMLAPYTCAPIDVYDRYRTIRGKSDIAEGVGLPLTRLLEIPANNAAQPCTSFGINENLPALKTLYDQEDLIFIANAGLLAKPVDVTNYRAETPVQLFAHDAMILEASREDLYVVSGGTGVGGRMAQVLTNAGIPTNMFSIYGQQTLLSGELGSASSQFILSSSGLTAFNAEPSIANMNDVIKALNNDNTADSGFHAETWSSKVTESMNRHKSLKEKVDTTNVTTLFPTDNDIANQFKLVTRLMQTRESRGSKRDIFYVQDGGYDTHAVVDENLIINFGRINSAIQAFVAELKALNLWNSTTVVQFSDFARTLNPNTGDGSDHGWGGHHFMFGGAVKGGKVLGRYPSDFNEGEGNNFALSRGRMIPEFPWDSMWLGTAEWFGIPPNSPGMDKVLPMHNNFASSLLYEKADLFDEIAPVAMSEQSAPMFSESVDNPSAFVDNPSEFVVNTVMRCGISEVDAREHCRSNCTTSSDCPFTMTCFSVHENFCGSIPQRIYVNPEVSIDSHRCGTSEIHSRTFCGAPCEWSADCTGGETCHGVHANYCGSYYTEMST